MTDTSKLFEVIENERQERRADIAGINARIDELLGAINKIGTPPQPVGLLFSYATVIISVFALLQIQMMDVSQDVNRHSDDIKIIQHLEAEATDIKQEIIRIRSWKDKTERDIPRLYERCGGGTRGLQTEL